MLCYISHTNTCYFTLMIQSWSYTVVGCRECTFVYVLWATHSLWKNWPLDGIVRDSEIQSEWAAVGWLENTFTTIVELEKSTHSSNVEKYAIGGGDFLDWKQINQENGMHRSRSTHRIASKYAYRLRDFRLSVRSRWELRCSRLLRVELWQFLTDVSGQPIGPILGVQE